MSAPSQIMPEWGIRGPSTPELGFAHAFSIHFDGSCIALVNATPEGSEALAQLIGNVPGLVTSMRLALHALSIAGNDSRAAFMEGAALLRAVKADHDHLEDKRVSVTGPLNEALRVFNGWFRTPLDRLKSAENVLKKKLGAFEQEEKRREEEEKRKRDAEAEANRQELERRAQAAAEKGNLEKALALQSRASAVVPQKADIIAPKAKGMGFGEKWYFEIEDVSKIPREYLVPDMAKIRLMVKALKNKEHAERQIPGIKVTLTANVSVRL